VTDRTLALAELAELHHNEWTLEQTALWLDACQSADMESWANERAGEEDFAAQLRPSAVLAAEWSAEASMATQK
jgi:hypothetical protein